MIVGLFSIVGAVVCSIVGAGFVATDLGKKLDDNLKDAANVLLNSAKEVKQIVRNN